MQFSIIGPYEGRGAESAPLMRDLSLDRILSRVLRGEDAGYLENIYMYPPSSADTVMMRQAVFRDLDGSPLFHASDVFSRTLMDAEELMDKLRPVIEGRKSGNILVSSLRALSAARDTIRASDDLLSAFSSCPPSSDALLSLLGYIERLKESGAYRKLSDEIEETMEELGKLSFVISIKGGTVRAARGGRGRSLLERAEGLFGPLAEGNVPQPPPGSGGRISDGTEERVLTMLSSLSRDAFCRLERTAAAVVRELPERQLVRTSRELRFYVSWISVMERIRSFGLPMSLPVFVGPGEGESTDSLYDVSLALDIGSSIVASPFILEKGERTAVLTGPNQGGKTTFARALGQMHHLASLGLPVQGNGARILLTDRVFSVFSEGEDRSLSKGRLEDDVRRFRSVIEEAGERSLIVMNELFSSTAVSDQEKLWSKALSLIRKKGSLALSVTFADASSREDGVVSLVSAVDERDPSVRTFRIERRPSEGSAYAESLARKYGLSYDALKEGN